MKKRRALVCAIICIVTALAMLMTSCDGGKTPPDPDPDIPTVDPSVPSEVPGADPATGYKVSFADGAGVSFVSDKKPGQRVEAGSKVSFTLNVSQFYEGTPVVYVGEKTVAPDENGTYSFTVNSDITVKVEGITLKSSSMEGSGDSLDDPFLITEPIDLLYIAQQVNLGNTAYSYGFYSLENDIDFQGEEMEIIGNGMSDTAVFCGYFNGKGHTISNYRIDSDSSQYVGFFGVLQADTVNSQGGAVNNLHLKDFTVTVSSAGMSSFCGSMVGYIMGGSLMLCSAENGVLDIYADSNSFAYAGGLCGIQQALDFNSLAYYSSISYSHSDVQLNCNSGSVFSAGGITGYLSASNQLVTASVNNSYAMGSVRGALRSGGVVGYLATGTAVVNCYAVGEVAAQTFATDAVNSNEFCYAYAGGVAGYSEADCVISECFSASELKVKASLGSDYEKTDGVLAYRAQPDEYNFGSVPATVYNCRYAKGGTDGDIKLTVGDYLKNELHWTSIDWSFSDGSYPTVNTEESTYEFTLSIKFGTSSDNDGDIFEAEGLSVYMPLSFWYSSGNIPSKLFGEDGDNRVSYRYYFDPEYTMPVPDSFVPTHTQQLYAAVADVSDIVGTYFVDVVTNGAPIQITINANGTFTYTDAGKTSTSSYMYDGHQIILESARLARYSDGGVSIGKYDLYDFVGTFENGVLTLIGGEYDADDDDVVPLYYTSESPLVAISADRALCGTYKGGSAIYVFNVDGTGSYRIGSEILVLSYTLSDGVLTVNYNGNVLNGTVSNDAIVLNGETLSAVDNFSGSWAVNSKANKVYTFDGFGGWSYIYYGYRRSGSSTVPVIYESLSGSYTLDGNTAVLSGELSGSAVLENGALTVKVDGDKVSCYREGSYTGTWTYADYGLTLTLGGIGASGIGNAKIEYEYSNGIIEAYELTYAIDELYTDFICLYYDYEVFGYMSYLPTRDTLNATVYVGPLSSFMQNVNLSRVDDYAGEWVGDIDGLTNISFDGLGAYTGYVTINGTKVLYKLDDATLSGSFVYDNTVYFISYNEITDKIEISGALYQRKDAFGNLTLVDGDGVLYTFDGRGELSSGGKLLISYSDGSSKEYGYFIRSGEVVITDESVEIGKIFLEAAASEYKFTLNGEENKSLRIKTKFTGVWGMSGSLTNMTIGSMGTDGKLSGVVNSKDVVFTMLDERTLSFEFSGTTFYAIFVGENNIVLSQYKDWYLYGDQILCAPIDDMFGTWRYSIGGIVSAWRFDGMSASTLTSGAAQTGILNNGDIENSISYYYNYTDGMYILWTIDETTGQTKIYRIEFCAVGERRAFVNEEGTRAFKIVEGDRLYKFEALDEESEITYLFDGFGSVTTSDGVEYAYEIVGDIDYVNGIIKVKLTAGGESRTATIDFSLSQATITFAS